MTSPGLAGDESLIEGLPQRLGVALAGVTEPIGVQSLVSPPGDEVAVVDPPHRGVGTWYWMNAAKRMIA